MVTSNLRSELVFSLLLSVHIIYQYVFSSNTNFSPNLLSSSLQSQYRKIFSLNFLSLAQVSKLTLCLRSECNIALMWFNLMSRLTGVAETGACRINWFGSKANKQLVHQPKEKTLEAFGRYAVCRHGCLSSSSLLHGECFGQPLPNGYVAVAPLIFEDHDYPIIYISEIVSRLYYHLNCTSCGIHLDGIQLILTRDRFIRCSSY